LARWWAYLTLLEERMEQRKICRAMTSSTAGDGQFQHRQISMNVSTSDLHGHRLESIALPTFHRDLRYGEWL
jgi:hypothetical protein